MRVQDRQLAVTLEWGLPDEALVEHAAERVDVGSRVHREALDLLGGRVVDGAEEEAGSGKALRGRVLDHAEVGQVDPLGWLCDQDVGGLDVAMNQVAIVRGVEAVRGLLEDEQRPPHPQRAFATDQGLEIAALDVAHRDEELSVGLAGVEDRHDVGVVDLGRAARLVDEALAKLRIGGQSRREELQCHLASELHVLRQVDDAHPAAADQRLDPVAGHRGTDARVVSHSCPEKKLSNDLRRLPGFVGVGSPMWRPRIQNDGGPRACGGLRCSLPEDRSVIELQDDDPLGDDGGHAAALVVDSPGGRRCDRGLDADRGVVEQEGRDAAAREIPDRR